MSEIYGDGTYRSFENTGNARDGTWHHVAMVRDGDNGIAYLDGSDFVGFMDGDETIPDGKFPHMLESIKKYDADICFVDMPRSAFSGLITNSLLVYFTCYLDYNVPVFI